jgi:hypothetical protein
MPVASSVAKSTDPFCVSPQAALRSFPEAATTQCRLTRTNGRYGSVKQKAPGGAVTSSADKKLRVWSVSRRVNGNNDAQLLDPV